MIVGIQQPEHVPWLGFFNKLLQVDLFVLLDHVQFKKRYFENRNLIRTNDRTQWITVPVQTKGRYTQAINEVEIDNEQNWSRKYLNSLNRTYARAPFFADRAPDVFKCIDRGWQKLSELNRELIQLLADQCRITTPIVLSSDLRVEGVSGSDLILAICEELSADIYVSGPNGRNYLDSGAFASKEIKLVYHDYEHPFYPQLHAPFISHLSTLDALFNVAEMEELVQGFTIPLEMAG